MDQLVETAAEWVATAAVEQQAAEGVEPLVVDEPSLAQEAVWASEEEAEPEGRYQGQVPKVEVQ